MKLAGMTRTKWQEITRNGRNKNKMTKKNWKDLFIGLNIIAMSTFLFFNGQYTIEIAILIGILTLWWLEFF